MNNQTDTSAEWFENEALRVADALMRHRLVGGSWGTDRELRVLAHCRSTVERMERVLNALRSLLPEAVMCTPAETVLAQVLRELAKSEDDTTIVRWQKALGEQGLGRVAASLVIPADDEDPFTEAPAEILAACRK